MRSVIHAVVLALSLSLLASPVFAYLDPGTGSIILQGIIAGVAAFGTVVSLNYHRLKAKLSKLFGKDDDGKASR